VREPQPAASGVALYARVAPADQKDDAVRQLQRLRDAAVARGSLVVAAVSELAAGLTAEQPQLRKVLTTPKVGLLVVEHPDRLTRGGSGSIATRLELQGRRVEALDPSAPGAGLVEECVVLLTRMAARSSGRSTSKRRAERIRAGVERVLHSEEARCRCCR
jgi:putative resolvase